MHCADTSSLCNAQMQWKERCRELQVGEASQCPPDCFSYPAMRATTAQVSGHGRSPRPTFRIGLRVLCVPIRLAEFWLLRLRSFQFLTPEVYKAIDNEVLLALVLIILRSGAVVTPGSNQQASVGLWLDDSDYSKKKQPNKPAVNKGTRAICTH